MIKYGRFLPFTIFDTLIQSALPRFIDDGDGGESSALDSIFPDATSDDLGKADEAPAADASVEEDKGKSDEEGEGNPDSSKEQDMEVDDDELSAALKSEETPDAKSERLERDFKASSKEARRLSAKDKALNKALEAQGLKVSEKDGEVHFIPTEKYSDKAVVKEVKLADLPAATLEAFESGDIDLIQPEIDKLLTKQAESLVRTLPTLDKEPKRISPEKKTGLFEHMTSAVDVNDNPKHENFAINQKHIEAAIKDNGLDAMFADKPEFMAEVLNNHINTLRAGIKATKQAAKDATDKKEKGAQADSELGVDGSGKPAAAAKGETAALDSIFGKRSG